MNEIESRIYSDAAAAAAEITDADISPLRLHARRGRAGRHGPSAGRAPITGPPRGGRTRRWLAPLAAAASVAAIIVVMITFGHAQPPGHGPTAGHRHSPAVPALSPAQTTLAAAALDDYFPASGVQYTAGLAFEWTKLKISAGIFGPCMAQAGFPQNPFTDPEATYLQSFADNSVFPDLAQRAQAHSMGGPNYINPNPTQPASAAGKKAWRRCTAASDQPFASIDKIASPLQNQWLATVTTIQRSAPVRAMQPSFSACLQARGVPAADAQQQDPRASNPLFYGFFAWADSLTQNATTVRQQAADDHRITRVFVACAGPTVSVVERLQFAHRATFFARYAQQIAAIKTLAMNLLSTGHSG